MKPKCVKNAFSPSRAFEYHLIEHAHLFGIQKYLQLPLMPTYDNNGSYTLISPQCGRRAPPHLFYIAVPPHRQP